MKKKLVLGLGLVTLILITSGAFIIWNLSEVYFGDKLKDEQEKILNSYDRILYHMKDTQADLYAHEAGYNRDRSLLDDDLLQARKLVSLIMQGYMFYSSQKACDYCHSLEKTGGGNKVFGKFRYHEKKLSDIHDRIAAYDEQIRTVIASERGEAARALVRKVIRDGEEIITLIHEVRSTMVKMDERLEQFHLTLVRRSLYLIVIAIAVSIMLSSVIVILMIRSLTGPVNTLVRGIEKVSSGDFSSRVSVKANDEIGFIAHAFNTMTERLSKVTMQKEMLLEELRDLNASLEQRVEKATEELKIAHEEVLRSETLSAVGTFAAGVAHELATPIASIMNYFQMVKDRIPKQDTLAEDVQIIEKELRRCNTILRGMLDFARAPEQEKVSTDINAIIRDLLALIRYQPAYKKTIVIKKTLDPGVPLITAVPGQLRQVFINIILNALQSMPEGGGLDVSTSLSADSAKAVVSISDTGHGIPADEIKKIFQPFYTGKKSGTGLGLSISYGIIKAHGGDMDIKSEPGKGTSFFICLPVSGNIHRSSETMGNSA